MAVKYIRIKFSNRESWLVPASVVASHRAEYYASKELDPDYRTQFEHEFEWVMKDDGELLDWMTNNMNWEDVEVHAHLEPEDDTVFFDYEEDWCRCSKDTIILCE